MSTPKYARFRVAMNEHRAYREGQLAAFAAGASKADLQVPEHLLCPTFGMPDDVFTPHMRRGYQESVAHFSTGGKPLGWAEHVSVLAANNGIDEDDMTHLTVKIATEEIEFYALRALRAEVEVRNLRLRLAVLDYALDHTPEAVP